MELAGLKSERSQPPHAFVYGRPRSAVRRSSAAQPGASINLWNVEDRTSSATGSDQLMAVMGGGRGKPGTRHRAGALHQGVISTLGKDLTRPDVAGRAPVEASARSRSCWHHVSAAW